MTTPEAGATLARGVHDDRDVPLRRSGHRRRPTPSGPDMRFAGSPALILLALLLANALLLHSRAPFSWVWVALAARATQLAFGYQRLRGDTVSIPDTLQEGVMPCPEPQHRGSTG